MSLMPKLHCEIDPTYMHRCQRYIPTDLNFVLDTLKGTAKKAPEGIALANYDVVHSPFFKLYLDILKVHDVNREGRCWSEDWLLQKQDCCVNSEQRRDMFVVLDGIVLKTKEEDGILRHFRFRALSIDGDPSTFVDLVKSTEHEEVHRPRPILLCDSQVDSNNVLCVILLVVDATSYKLYNTIKIGCDMTVGVRSQTLLKKTIFKLPYETPMQNSTIRNIIMRLSAKMGGQINQIRTYLESWEKFLNPNKLTLSISDNETHFPQSNMQFPSINSLKANVDIEASKYVASMRFQVKRSQWINANSPVVNRGIVLPTIDDRSIAKEYINLRGHKKAFEFLVCAQNRIIFAGLSFRMPQLSSIPAKKRDDNPARIFIECMQDYSRESLPEFMVYVLVNRGRPLDHVRNYLNRDRTRPLSAKKLRIEELYHNQKYSALPIRTNLFEKQALLYETCVIQFFCGGRRNQLTNKRRGDNIFPNRSPGEHANYGAYLLENYAYPILSGTIVRYTPIFIAAFELKKDSDEELDIFKMTCLCFNELYAFQ
uniref:PAZ domain-containing protein n=1 Tax=Ditylenchus dipsaci TaxID=166011 RepID=A0A915DD48_9BILA